MPPIPRRILARCLGGQEQSAGRVGKEWRVQASHWQLELRALNVSKGPGQRCQGLL